MNELIEYIKEKKGKISWNSNFIKKYILYINEQVIELKLTSKGEYIYYLFHDKTLPNSICKCGKKKKFSSFKNPYREFCSTKCSNKFLMTEERKANNSIKAKELYNNYSEEKKQAMIEDQKKSFKENWTEADSIRYSNIVKERYKDVNYSNKIRKTNEQLGYWTPEEDLSNFELYKKKVWLHTNKNNLDNLKNIKKRGNLFHLDHKYSIFEGFKNGIPSYIIGNICNLEIIPASINCSKRGNCSITKEELFSSFEKLIGD